ncbi:MAG TPA: hypothetical protein DEQ43_05625 [Nocardioides bacterium]|nr:hypothetical protein [Nocardioides sp.]
MLRRHGQEPGRGRAHEAPRSTGPGVRRDRPHRTGGDVVTHTLGDLLRSSANSVPEVRVDVAALVADADRRQRRRRLAVVAGDDERAQRRTAAFGAAARELGLAEVRAVAVPAPTTLRSGREALRALLAGEGGGPDAVFCSSDLLAMGALTEARVRGVRVPEDLAVVGFGDLEFSGDTSPSLTTVRIHGAEIGRHAARFIVERAEGRDPGPRIIDLGFSVIARESA